jgi:hypothetical protein
MYWQNVMYSLEIMGKGMLSIFVVILILTGIVVLLTKITNLPSLKKHDDSEE